MSRATGLIRKGQFFKSPVWYSKCLNDNIMLLQTTVEPGKSVSTNESTLFVSMNCVDWTLVSSFEKDIFSMVFKFGNFCFADGKQYSYDFIICGEALKGIDGRSFRVRLTKTAAEICK